MSEDSTNQAVSGSDVFVSYASMDGAVATSIVENLEAQGVKCWVAPRDVKPGAQYADAIVRAITEAKAVVLVLSGSAVGSSHVGREVERAASKHKQIIAFRIDAAALSPGLEYFLSESQWIDVPKLGMPAALAKLQEAVGHVSGASSPAPTSSHSVDAKRTAKLVIVAVVVVIAVVAAVVIGVHFWSSKHGGAQTPAVAAITDKSIAVLPFVDMSEKKDQEYFADGVAEEVLDRLATIPGLRVVGRASSFQFKGYRADTASIGRSLGVAYLLDGSVRRDAGRVRVTAQLVDARTGVQRWSDHYDSDTVGVLHVQDSIAAELARALQIAVEVGIAPQLSIKSPEAFDAYLRGRQFLDRSTREGCEAAVANFRKALALDPTFEPAALGLARAFLFIGAMAWLPTPIAFERARDAALLAKRLDPVNPLPHVALADVYLHYDWDWDAADRELRQAFRLGPREPFGLRIAARLASSRGQWDQAWQLASEAIALDPLDADANGTIGFEVYLRTGQFAEAEQSFRRALQIAPAWGAGHYALGVALMLQGRRDEALVEFSKERLQDGKLEGTAMIQYLAGRKVESDAQLAQAIQRNGASWPSEIARVYAVRGEKDRAFEWLARAYDARDEDLCFIKGDPLFKNIQYDPRYKAFLKKMNLPE
jgi:TolB-like protein/tetratricopeptide (TPR) repeat protein